MDKIYIIANKEQELDVLDKLEQEGFKWYGNGKLPTTYILSNSDILNPIFIGFPYSLIVDEDGTIAWSNDSNYHKGNIVYDGRKEDKMSDKYLITKEFMDDLKKWRDEHNIKLDLTEPFSYVTGMDFYQFPDQVAEWWAGATSNPWEINNRLMAIIQWLNGEDVFETQKTYKYYIARTSSPVMYFSMKKWYHSEFPKYDTISSEKKVFDTREEAEKWLIPDYEVVEIDENEL